MTEINGRTAFVTGGGGGIGGALCRALVDRGARVAVADASLARAEAVADGCGDGAVAIGVDVTDRASLAAAVERARAVWGRGVDLCFANAGVMPPAGSVLERSEDDWRFALEVNVLGLANTVDACLDDLRASDAAHIMVTSSGGGLQVAGHLPLGIYSVSKYAAVGYAEELRAVLRDEPIGVSVLCPGLVDTAMGHHTSEVRPPERGAQAVPRYHGLSPRLRPLAITAEQAAEVAVDGMRDDRFYVLTHATTGERLHEHYGALLAEIEGQGVAPGLEEDGGS